jgi:hypothetical protein
MTRIHHRSSTAVAAIAVTLGIGILPVGATPANAATLDGVQYTYAATFASGAQSSSDTAITPATPTGKVFVIQTVSIYRYPGSTSTLQSFVGLSSGGYFALPDIGGSSGDFYPATTMNLTAYVPGGANAFVNLYRTGGSYPAETDYVTVSGYVTSGS